MGFKYETKRAKEELLLDSSHLEQIQNHGPKPKLKADKKNSTITIDEHTSIVGVPQIAWQYRLANRSALEWVLDHYKAKKPSDPIVAEKFNTYRFSDHKNTVVEY